MGIAWLVFRENVDRRLLVGAFAILTGAVLLSWQGTAALDRGALLIAGACLCWGIDNNLTRKLSSADPVQIAMIKGLVAGAFNLLLALARGAALPLASTLLAARCRRFPGLWCEPRCCSWSPCAISAPRGPAPTSRSRHSSERRSPCSCSAIRSQRGC